jgi:hypothetical protein
VVLGEAELLEGSAGGDLDLCGDNVDAGDFFGDGVLDLTVVILALVHQMTGGRYRVSESPRGCTRCVER